MKMRATFALVKKHALRMTENEEENKKEEKEEKERKNEPINELNPNVDRNKKRLFEEEKEGALRMMKRSIGSIDKNNQKETEKFEMGRKQRDVQALMQKSMEEKEKSGKEIEKEIEESRRIMHRKRLDNMEKKRNNLLAQLEIENERNWGNKREYNSGRRFEKGGNNERRRIEKRMENEYRSEGRTERIKEKEDKNETEKQQKNVNEKMKSTIKIVEEKPEGEVNKQLNNSCSIAEELKKLEEIIKERNDENNGSKRESLEDRLRKLKERIGSGGGQKARNRYDHSTTPPRPPILPLEEIEKRDNLDYICGCPIWADAILDGSGTNIPKIFKQIRGRPIPSIIHAFCLDYQIRHHHIKTFGPSFFIEIPEIEVTLESFVDWVAWKNEKECWKEEKIEKIVKIWTACPHKISAIKGEKKLELNWPQLSKSHLEIWSKPLKKRIGMIVDKIQLEEKMKEKAKEAVRKKEAEENERKRKEAEIRKQKEERNQ